LNDILVSSKKGRIGFDPVLMDKRLIEENIKSVFGK